MDGQHIFLSRQLNGPHVVKHKQDFDLRRKLLLAFVWKIGQGQAKVKLQLPARDTRGSPSITNDDTGTAERRLMRESLIQYHCEYLL
jgi:hypothetical protein